MNTPSRLLQAEINNDLEMITDAYNRLRPFAQREMDEDTCILISYHLHVIYGLFENMFTRISLTFGNQIEDSPRWHTILLKRMTLDIPEVRPPVIRDESYRYLDELRRFRHLFRNAYLLRFDAERLLLVLRDAQKLEQSYPADIKKFLTFLNF